MSESTPRELTERIEKLTAELRQLEARYKDLEDRSVHLRSLMKNAQAFAAYRLSVDPGNSYRSRVVMISDSMKDILGIDNPWDQNEWFKIMHPDDIDRMLHAQEQAMRTYRLDETIRFFHSRRQEWRWVHCMVTCKPEPSGEARFFEGILTDVTEVKKNELELNKYRTHLEQLVDQRTRELSVSNQKLKKALEDNELLFREMHHRIHNNLFSIMTLLELQSRTADSEVALEAFQDCQDRISAMCMVHRRLYMSEDPLCIDAEHYLGELATAILKAYGRAGGRITLSLGAEGIVLQADRAVTLGFIINELITNTLKHKLAEPAGGAIDFRLHYLPDTEEFELSYQDSGPGDAPGQGDGAETALGLSLISSLVESQLKGRIMAGASSGQGFVFRFPAQAPRREDADWRC